MSRKALFASVAGIALLVSLFVSGTGDAWKKGSGTSMVSIDGKSFRSSDSFFGDMRILRQEMARLGVEAPRELVIPEESDPSNPVFSEKVVGSGKRSPEKAPHVPPGLAADHSIRMSGGGGGTVELVMGRLEGGSASVAARLESDRWKSVQAAGNQRLPRILEKTRGKETSIVCLDETESIFLLLRKVGR